MKTILDNIKKIRLIRGYDQKYMSQKLNIASNNYSLLENGKIALTVDRLDKIAEILEVSIWELYNVPDRPTVRLPKHLMVNIPDGGNYISDIDKGTIISLEKDIISNAAKGRGLVFLEYDFIANRFFSEYRDLKTPLSKDEFKKLLDKQGDMMWENIIDDIQKDYNEDFTVKKKKK